MASGHADFGGGSGSGSVKTSDVILPDVDTMKGALILRPQRTIIGTDYLPDEILLALTQRPTAPIENLAPLQRTKTAAGKTSSVWNFGKRREKLKHLTDSPACICGAGKDISFLYDVPPSPHKEEKPSKFDPSAARKSHEGKKAEKPEVKVPDTLIPEEYHLVKNKGVMGLEYHDEKYTTCADDHEKHLVVFPSMAPSSRFEVLQLKKTMIEMLEKAGVGEEVEVTGPTQMHRLLDLVKKEQDIYNVVFHELIRQTTVECMERGELLANLRQRYNNLLAKVPELVKSLHNEVVAQRALDRRLTEELMRFKTTIGVLTSELADVKQHDKRVTSEALQAQAELKEALDDSKKNADLLTEYHTLYELQRHRLEQLVNQLNEEKELWSSTAYCLAIKVTDENALTTAKRLHVAEKSWNQLASHFSLLLTDRDTEALTHLQGFVDTWRDKAEQFTLQLLLREREAVRKLTELKKKIMQFGEQFDEEFVDEEGKVAHVPSTEQMNEILQLIMEWEETLNEELESFGGESMLELQECLNAMKHLVEQWTDTSIKIFSRHRQEDGTNYPEHDHMVHVNKLIDELVAQFLVRLTGDNGLARGLIGLLNGLESWHTRLQVVVAGGGKPVTAAEWTRLVGQLEEWADSVEAARHCVGRAEREEDRAAKKEHTRLEVTDVIQSVQKWMSATTSGVTSEDVRLVESVAQLHNAMVRWMIQTLLRLAPDHPGNSPEARQAALIASASEREIHQMAVNLFTRLVTFSSYVQQCCSAIVSEITQAKLDLHEDDAEVEANELKRFRMEADEWIVTAKILLEELDTGDVAIDIKDPLKELMAAKEEPLVVEPAEKEETVEQKEETEIAPDGEPEDAVAAEPEGEPQGEPTETLPPTEPEEMGEQKTEEEEVVPPAEEEQAQGDEQIEAIGYDQNTRARALVQDPDVPQEDKVALEEGILVDVPDTERAFQALEAVKRLQIQLGESEDRAQTAEERAMKLELELAEYKERNAAMELKIETLQKEVKEVQAALEAAEVKPALLDEPGPSALEIVAAQKKAAEDEEDPIPLGMQAPQRPTAARSGKTPHQKPPAKKHK